VGGGQVACWVALRFASAQPGVQNGCGLNGHNGVSKCMPIMSVIGMQMLHKRDFLEFIF